MSLCLIRKGVDAITMKRCSVSALLKQSRLCSSLNPSKWNDYAIIKREDNEPSYRKPEGRQKTIAINGPNDISAVSGIPDYHRKERLVRIYASPKNAMQSGTSNVGSWVMEFDAKQRWENPLMGWASTGDALSNMKVQFPDKESAIDFADKSGYQWSVEPEKKITPKFKSYGFNFSWSKRTRASTK